MSHQKYLDEELARRSRKLNRKAATKSHWYYDLLLAIQKKDKTQLTEILSKHPVDTIVFDFNIVKLLRLLSWAAYYDCHTFIKQIRGHIDHITMVYTWKCAIKRNSRRVVELLLTEIDAHNINNGFLVAVLFHQWQMAELLLDKVTNISSETVDNLIREKTYKLLESCMFMSFQLLEEKVNSVKLAMASNDTSIVSLLLEHYKLDTESITELYLQSRQSEISQLLLKYGAKPKLTQKL